MTMSDTDINFLVISSGRHFALSLHPDLSAHVVFLILHTKEYREFCDLIWGDFQHHPRGSQFDEMHGIAAGDINASASGLYPHDPENHRLAFSETMRLYQEVFGLRTPRFGTKRSMKAK